MGKKPFQIQLSISVFIHIDAYGVMLQMRDRFGELSRQIDVTWRPFFVMIRGFGEDLITFP